MLKKRLGGVGERGREREKRGKKGEEKRGGLREEENKKKTFRKC